MFDLGWQEFLMVAMVLMLVVGPKDLPRILRSVSQMMRKAKGMAREFTSSLEEVARQDEFKDMKDILADAKSANFDEMANIIGGDLKQTANDMKAASGYDDMRDDVTTIASSDSTVPAPKTKKKAAKAAAKKPAKKPAKNTAKNTAKKASKKPAKKAAKS